MGTAIILWFIAAYVVAVVAFVVVAAGTGRYSSILGITAEAFNCIGYQMEIEVQDRTLMQNPAKQ